MFHYSNMNDLGLTQRECENVLKQRNFQEILRVRRNIYFRELAQDSTMTKTAAEGMAIVSIRRLMEKGQEDKALNGIMQLAKLKGWTTEQANINIFQDLSAKDLADLRNKVKPAAISKEN